MIKRLMIVISVVLAIIFVPYYVGNVIQKLGFFHNTDSGSIHIVGFVTLIVSIFLFVILFRIIKWIKDGE